MPCRLMSAAGLCSLGYDVSRQWPGRGLLAAALLLPSEPSQRRRLERPMRDMSGQPNPVKERSGSSLTAVLTVGLILAVAILAGIGGFAAWHSSVSANDVEVVQTSSAAPVRVDVPSPVVAATLAPSGNDLRETVDALQSTQGQILTEIASIKQKIAAEQGERKLLTAQLGSLSLRLDELSAASASMAESATTGQSQKKRAKSR